MVESIEAKLGEGRQHCEGTRQGFQCAGWLEFRIFAVILALHAVGLVRAAVQRCSGAALALGVSLPGVRGIRRRAS